MGMRARMIIHLVLLLIMLFGEFFSLAETVPVGIILLSVMGADCVHQQICSIDRG